MALNVGVNVVEVDGNAPATILAAPTSVAAFVGVTERGVSNMPVQISSSQQFQNRFGNYPAAGYLAYAVDGFFLNGGFAAYVVRVVGATAAAAFVVLNNRLGAPTPTLRVAAGFRGREDPAPGANGFMSTCGTIRAAPPLCRSPRPPTRPARSSNHSPGCRIGTVVRLVDGANAFYRKITSIDPTTRTLHWAATAPIGPSLAVTATATSAEFQLSVRYRTDAISSFAVVEDWRNLSMETNSADYVASRINDAFTGSQYVTVADLSGTTASGDENPAVASESGARK